MTGRVNIAGRRAAAIGCAIVLALAVALPTAAFAVDDGNAVNPRQTPDNSFLYDTDIAELSSAQASMEGQTVQITGEAIGEAIRDDAAPDRRWVSLASLEAGKESSVSVIMDYDQAMLIDTYGAYGKTGSTVRVKGTFHLTCPEHEGLCDVHADTVTVVEPGKTVHGELTIDGFIPGIILCAIGVVLLLVFRFLRERLR